MTKISSRSREVAEKIRDHVAFETYGALKATLADRLSRWDSGQLAGEDLEKFYADLPQITYVVWSYSTPIAWVCSDGNFHKVSQRFSVTTSKHQGKLYLLS